MRTLSSVYRTTASGDANQPVEIYDLFLDSQTLHFINYDKNITFYDLSNNSQVYTALPIHREAYERSADNPINSIVVGVANVDRSISAYLASDDFRGRRIVIRKIFADQLTSSGDAAIIFDGVMDTPAASEETVQVNAVDRIGTLNREGPRRWYQLLCNWKFGDEFCFYGRTSGDMYATLNCTCVSGTTVTQLKSTNITQAIDYWIDGEIQMTSGQNALKKKKVIASSGDPVNMVNLDISLDYTPVNGDTFNLRRGCDKTWFRCSGDFQNDANFGSFPTIPESMIIRSLLFIIGYGNLLYLLKGALYC